MNLFAASASSSFQRLRPAFLIERSPASKALRGGNAAILGGLTCLTAFPPMARDSSTPFNQVSLFGNAR
jgi:hypothetical protein